MRQGQKWPSLFVSRVSIKALNKLEIRKIQGVGHDRTTIIANKNSAVQGSQPDANVRTIILSDYKSERAMSAVPDLQSGTNNSQLIGICNSDSNYFRITNPKEQMAIDQEPVKIDGTVKDTSGAEIEYADVYVQKLDDASINQIDITDFFGE